MRGGEKKVLPEGGVRGGERRALPEGGEEKRRELCLGGGVFYST